MNVPIAEEGRQQTRRRRSRLRTGSVLFLLSLGVWKTAVFRLAVGVSSSSKLMREQQPPDGPSRTEGPTPKNIGRPMDSEIHPRNRNERDHDRGKSDHQ